MKRIFAAAAALAVCLTVTSCGDKITLPEDTSAIEQYIAEVSETTGTEETAIPETVTTASEAAETMEATVTEREYMQDEKALLNFLEYLQNGTPHDFSFTLNYDFWDDFTIDSYSYKRRDDGAYDVKLTCSESSCDLFPDGESDWYFNICADTVFCTAETVEKIEKRSEIHHIYRKSGSGNENIKNAYLAAVDFSLFTDVFEADAEWFENYTDIDVHGFYHAYDPYVVISDYGEKKFYDVTPEAFAAAVKKLYNINMTAEQACLMADESGFMIKSCGHGGIWLYDNLAGYEETEDEIKVRVDYYGDELYLFVTVQSEYTFSKNEDGTITLQKVEKIFDKGYEPARGRI